MTQYAINKENIEYWAENSKVLEIRGMFQMLLIDCLEPIEEKEEPQWRFEGSIGCHHNVLGMCVSHGYELKCDCPCHKKEERCTNCNGTGDSAYGSAGYSKKICTHCNGTGKDPRNECCDLCKDKDAAIRTSCGECECHKSQWNTHLSCF